MTALFAQLMRCPGPPSLRDHGYRHALKLLQVDRVRCEAQGSELWEPAWHYAREWAPDGRSALTRWHVIAVQPDVLAGRKTLQGAEIAVLSVAWDDHPAKRRSYQVQATARFDDRLAASPLIPADLATPAQMIAQAGSYLLDQLERVAGCTITAEARGYIVNCWEPYAAWLADNSAYFGLDGLGATEGAAVRRAQLAYRQVAPPGVNHQQTLACRRLLVGTLKTPGLLPWLAKGRKIADAVRVQPRVLISWTTAAVQCDPGTAAHPHLDALQAHIWRREAGRIVALRAGLVGLPDERGLHLALTAS